MGKRGHFPENRLKFHGGGRAKACCREEGRVSGSGDDKPSRIGVGTRARLREDKLHQSLRGRWLVERWGLVIGVAY